MRFMQKKDYSGLKNQVVRKIRGKISDRQWRNWRWQIKNRITDVSQIADLMIWPPIQQAELKTVSAHYPFCVTPYYLSLCDPNDAQDPIRRQFFPDRRELLNKSAAADPLGERHYEPVPGLIHRYRNRVVVVVTHDCAVRCRHCTRKNTLASFGADSMFRNCDKVAKQPFIQMKTGMMWQKVGRGVSLSAIAPLASAKPPAEPGCATADAEPSDGEWLTRPPSLGSFGGPGRVRPTRGDAAPYLIAQRLPAIIKYIRQRPYIREVIVSGGDPLLLETFVLDRILGELHSIKHVEVLRIGTRAPVVLPMRIDAELCVCLKKHRPLWINTQFNHPREITAESQVACRRLQEAGLPVSCQTVLLRGVNDSFAVLSKLCNDLQRILVRPYYIFQCDPVRGIRHFITPLSKSLKLAKRLRSELGGLSMPLFMTDVPGRRSKIPLELAAF